MQIKAQLISKKKDNVTFCCLSEGYDNSTEIELDGYLEVGTVKGELPESDEIWPNSPLKNG